MSHIETMIEQDPLDNNQTNKQEALVSASGSSDTEGEGAFQEEVMDSSIEVREEDHSDEGIAERKTNSYLDALKAEINAIEDPDTRLQKAMDFMEASLAQSGTPHFKSFWEARTLCLELFKENISPSHRAQLWTKYSELSKEARRLKEILDEQSSFAAEQIEIAIKALEDDLANFQEQIDTLPPIEFPTPCEVLEPHLSTYQGYQQALNLLNAQASRINALRKELIKTDMRVRVKNKFFQRLSQIGDLVFPKRKELIKDVSNLFIQDVDQFIEEYFTTEQFDQSIFFLREEIKALQGIAKVLTLNTHSFTHTRMRLSECWDKIKVFEKERKKVRAQQKAVFKQNVDLVKAKIEEFEKTFTGGEVSILEGQKQLDDIAAFMRTVELGRDELKFLREQLALARKPILEKIKADEADRQHQDQERQRSKRKKLQDIKEQIETVLQSIGTQDIDALAAEKESILEKINEGGFGKPEKQELERLHKELKNALADAITEKKEKALMSLSDDRRQDIEQLREVLEQRKARRNEIKVQLESFRKASGSSGLDFQQAMAYNAQINAEKERLEKINQGIKEIEDKLEELESDL